MKGKMMLRGGGLINSKKFFIFKFIIFTFFILYLSFSPLKVFAADYTMKQNPFPEPWSNTILDFSKCTVKRGSGFSLSHSTDGSKMWSGFNTSKNSNYSVLYENVFHRGDQYWDMRIYFWCNSANGYAIRADGSTADGITSRANLQEVINGSQSFNRSLPNVFDAEFHFYKHGEKTEDPNFKGILWWIDLDTDEGVKPISGIKDCYRVPNTTVTKRSDGWYRGTKSSEEVSDNSRLIVVMTTNSGISHIKYDACSGYGTNYGRSISNISYTLSSLSEYQPNKTIFTSPINTYGTHTVLNPQQQVNKYRFFGWYSDNACTQKVTKINMIQTATKLYGRYEKLYDIATLGEHVTIDDPISDIIKGSSKTITWNVKDGYFITDVIVDGVSQPVTDILNGSITFSNINADHVVSVKAKKCYEITTEVENGSISPSVTKIYPNEERTISYSPMDGYMIKSIIVDDEEIPLQDNLDSYTFTNINTNHHIKVIYEKIPTKDLQVIGIWDDDDNRDGYRPKRLEISYLVNDEEREVLSLTEDTNWEAEKVNLPLYNQYREVIIYDFEALDYECIDEYEVSDEKTELVFKFINKHKPRKVTSKITKIWDDSDNHDGFRPNSINVELYKNGTVIKTVTLNDENNWTYTEENLYENEHIGNRNVYSWKEISYENENKYVTSIKQDRDNTIITNSHLVEKVESKITKIWNDNNDTDGYRPSNLDVSLYKNDKVIKTVTLNDDNDWVYIESNLDKYDPIGKLNTYYWKETTDYLNRDKYEVSESQEDYNTTITNTHKAETNSSTVTKIWDDNDDNDGYRPEKIYVKLYQDNTIIEPRIILNESNNYTYTESDLPKYHDGGKEYQYKWDEYTTYNNADKYTYTKEQNGNNTTITNTHEIETVNVQVQKLWEDNNNHDKVRPTEIEVQLLANNKVIRIIKLNNLSDWKTTITDLPKYENGKEINYTFKEATQYGDYISKVETKKNLTMITNSRTDYQTSLSVTKEWDDNNNQDNLRSEEVQVQILADDEVIDEIILNSENNWTKTINNLPLNNSNGEKINYSVKEVKVNENYTCKIEKENNNFKIINTHEPEVLSFNITKTWDDNNNQDGLRPEEITVKLFKNGQESQLINLNKTNNWKTTISNLPKYENGKEINYTFEEIDISNYESNLKVENNEVIITNTHVPETKDITIQKEWKDINNRYGIRPEEIRYALLANGKVIKESILSESNNWVETIADLPVKASGKIIEYSVHELNVMGYRSNISEIDNTFIITNELDLTVHGPEEMVIGVRKDWDDDNNRDAIRPSEIRVNLLVNNHYYKGYTLNETNNWQVEIHNLISSNDKINYTWEEEIPDNYTNEMIEKDRITTITNVYTPEVTTASVKKVWEDNNNQDGIRPEEVEVILYANDEPTDKTLILSNENDWHGTISKLPKNEDGKEVTYTFKLKEAIDKYATSYDFEPETNTTIITSSYKPEKVNMEVENEWIDDNNRDGIRPNEIDVVLLNNNHIVLDSEDNPIVVNLSENNNWENTLESLPKYTEGVKNQYSFRLKNAIDKYTSTYEDEDYRTKISNEHIPERVNLEVQKEWIDDDNNDGFRPDEVTVILMKNEETTDMELVLNKDNNWNGEIKNQFKYENGEEIKYNFVLKGAINKYETTYEQENYKTIITSEHIPEEILLEVEKKWIDDDNKDGFRPDEVTVILVVNGELFDIKLKLNKDNDWRGELTQPKYKNGEELHYNFVLESEIDRYITDYEQKDYKTIITSEYNPEKVKPEIQLIWDDLDNKYQKRPNEVVVRLYINGEPTDVVVTLNKDNNWYAQLEAMNKYKDDKEIEYKFIEEVPEGYKESYEYDGNKTIITNYLREENTPVINSPESTQKQEIVKINESNISQEKPELKEGKVEKVKTEDTTFICLFIVLICISGICLICKYKKK